MKAMTGRRDNDTSVKSKVERDKTVATKDDGCGRTSRWEIPMELYAKPSDVFLYRRVSRINGDNRIT